MTWMLRSTMIFLTVYLAMGLHAQEDQVRFEHITTAQGLSEDVVNCIYQDRRGFMWFGTDDGLNRYDGYTFTQFQPSPDDSNAINSNIIFSVTEDLHGNIWIGTTGSGLNCFDPETEKFTEYRHVPDDSTTLTDDHIMHLFKDSKGRVWIGSLDGLTLLQPGAKKADALTFLRLKLGFMSPNIVYNIAEDRRGAIWIGTGFGLFQCVEHSDHEFDITRVRITDDVDPQEVTCIILDSQGGLVVGTYEGLYHQTTPGDLHSFKRVSNTPDHRALIGDDHGVIWSGTNEGLLSFEQPRRNSPLVPKGIFTSKVENPYSLNHNVVKSLFKDNAGIIWIGTNGGGVNNFDPSRKKFMHYGLNLNRNGRNYRKIRSIFEDSDRNLWIGTEGGGLFGRSQFSTEYQEFQQAESSKNVFAIEEVVQRGEKYLFVGSGDRPFLRKLKVTAGMIQSAIPVATDRGSIFALLQDAQQDLWIGTYNRGLLRWRYDPGKDAYSEVVFEATGESGGLSNNIIRKLMQDRKGNIWIATGDGLNMIEADQVGEPQPTFRVFRHIKDDRNSLSHNYIFDIYESTSGQIWIATFGGGLNKVEFRGPDKKAYFIRYMEEDGLGDNSVKSIEEDIDGNLWIGTNRGLTKFDPQRVIFQNYLVNDGLQGHEFLEGASCKTSDGTLLFGGVNGFNVFYPQQIADDRTAPSVTLTKLYVNNRAVGPSELVNHKVILSKPLSVTKEIELRYNQNDFSVEFSALAYTGSSHYRYAFFLEGYHDQWVEEDADQRHATFTNLSHGEYILSVKSCARNNVWSAQPTQLAITIKPPPWLTWYAYLFYALLVIFGLLLYRRYTIIGVHEKHELMMERMEREKLEELNQMKLRFFTNISHELRTPLTLIISPLEHILTKGKSITPDKLLQHYHYMYKNSKYLLRLVNQLLDFRKLDQGSLTIRVGEADVIDFILETTEPFQFVANKKNIVFRVVYDRHFDAYFDPEVLEKILYNLLSNAFKFTPSGGEVVLEVKDTATGTRRQRSTSPLLEISVQDSGPGISRTKLRKIFERFYKDGSRAENKDGAGIGLSYTKSLIELHRGSIQVENIREGGAHFRVWLPKSRSAYLKSEIVRDQMAYFQLSSDPLDYMVVEPIVPASIEGGSGDVEELLPLLLCVDDHTDIRRFIRDGLASDFRIIDAEDGKSGYELALSSLPDIIVSDVMMPEMNGFELCHALKSNPFTSHIPIILLTAKTSDKDEIEGFETGADAYVVKPFKLHVLKAQLLNIHLQRESLKKRFRNEVITEPADVTVTSADEEFLQKAMAIIEEHMGDSEFNVEALVKEMHISRSKIYLKLKALTGQSSSEFIRTVRLKRAIQLLVQSDFSIKEVMFMTGFNSASYFSKCFKKQFGVVPSEYLKQQRKSVEL